MYNKFTKRGRDNISHEPAQLPLASDDRGHEAALPSGETQNEIISSCENKPVAPNEQKLAHSLCAVSGLPQKFSRSYLVPYTEHLLRLQRKGYSIRDMIKWLNEEHGERPSLSTFSNFMKKAKQEERRIRRTQAGKAAAPLDEPAPDADNTRLIPINKPLRSGQASAAQMREAIQAAKERAESARQLGDTPLFTFNDNKPLIDNTNTKSK